MDEEAKKTMDEAQAAEAIDSAMNSAIQTIADAALRDEVTARAASKVAEEAAKKAEEASHEAHLMAQEAMKLMRQVIAEVARQSDEAGASAEGPTCADEDAASVNGERDGQ